jgi:transcriptional regulator with XRE-family HTH domain
MGAKKRPRPQHLPAKLLMIREAYNASQSQIACALKVNNIARISEVERGIREPNVLLLLSYARLAHIPLEYLVDDRIIPAKFRYILGMKERFLDSRNRFITRRGSG